MSIFSFIISILLLSFQLLLIVKWSGKFIKSRKRRKLISNITDFHSKYYKDAISVIFDNYINSSDMVYKSQILLDEFVNISDMYFSGCSLHELETAFLKFKILYGEYLPVVKKELRSITIDSILTE